ncbi:hypothetical protein [Massilia putida]|uniref:hypothetical protein n=1 Tax=Massilia putida TaxID=1141883 RepID=UPI0012EC4058|nr:hypothetical protein [Massilia putida]
MLKQLTAGMALASLVALPAMAAPETMTSGQLDEVVAGTDSCCCPPPTTQKGNNGWGNGADPSNPGSDHGLTAPSKTNNLNLPPGQNRPNTNPTGSTGR